MDCKICFELFDEKVRIPKVLSCGHTFCIECLNTLKRIRNLCPLCQRRIDQNPQEMISNYEILQNRFSIECQGIIIRDITNNRITIDIEIDKKVELLIQKVESIKGIDKQEFFLLYDGQQMQSQRQLKDYLRGQYPIVNLVQRFRGGKGCFNIIKRAAKRRKYQNS